MKQQSFDVAIVLINYNNIQDTKECIQSIAQTDGPIPFVFVIDNASRDGSILQQELSFYPYLKCFVSQENLGFGRANNLAIDWILKNLNSAYLFILNNDTIIEPDTIKNLIKGLEKADDSIAVATPLIRVYSNTEEIWYAGGTINFNKMVPEVSNSEVQHEKVTDFASGCAMFFRTTILKNLKGFDPFYFMYDEDVEFSIQIKKSGYHILYVPSAVVYHKCQGSQTKQKDIPSNQLHPYHPSLVFYLNNTIVNRRYTIDKHLMGYKKIKAKTYQATYWISKSIQFALYGKRKAFYTTLKSLTTKYHTKNPNFS